MRLVFLHYSMQAGGAERTMALLANYVAMQGHFVSIVTLDNLPSFYLLDSKVTHTYLNIAKESKNTIDGIVNNLKSLKKINKEFSKLSPDIVICFGPNTILLSFLARKQLKYKIVGSERSNPYVKINNFWDNHKKLFSKLCDGFLFQTKGAQSFYPKSTQRKSLILKNCIVAEDFEYLEKPWKQRVNICAVGRMDKFKCFGDLINAFKIVHKQFSQVCLDIYGDGPLRSELEALSKSLNLQNSIIFNGKNNNIYNEYANHKCFIMGSAVEGMPNVLIEALASGCACVSTDCDFGPSELIENGVNGFLVPLHDQVAMANCICSLLKDEELCQRISEKAKLIKKSHDINNIGQVFLKYLNKFLI